LPVGGLGDVAALDHDDDRIVHDDHDHGGADDDGSTADDHGPATADTGGGSEQRRFVEWLRRVSARLVEGRERSRVRLHLRALGRGAPPAAAGDPADVVARPAAPADRADHDTADDVAR
jgi:hypothetical protein